MEVDLVASRATKATVVGLDKQWIDATEPTLPADGCVRAGLRPVLSAGGGQRNVEFGTTELIARR